MSKQELLSFLDVENKSSMDYKNKYWLIMLGGKILNYLGIEGRHYR